MSKYRLLLAFVGTASLGARSNGQELLYQHGGESGDDHFGSVAGAGDVNGDGYDDVIVGAYRDDGNGTDSGSARVFSGLDGSVLHDFDGLASKDSFGGSVDGAGDVNADGFADLIVGASGADVNGPDSGSAYVFSGLDGSLLYTFQGHSSDDRFGVVAGAGDVDQDGYADVVVGASTDDSNGHHAGAAYVFSGFDGSVLHSLFGDPFDAHFGDRVSGAGDVNADGHADVIVGAGYNDANGTDSGSVFVFSGLDGSLLYKIDGDDVGDLFGAAVSGAGDVNADGHDDFIVGAVWDDPNGNESGSARVYSGLDGSVLYTFDGELGAQMGYDVSDAGDVNGDGHTDLIVGAFGSGGGGPAAHVFSGIDGTLLHSHHGGSTSAFAASVGGAGDVDGDGHDDTIVGAPAGNGDPGLARIYAGCDPLGTVFCDSSQNPNNAATISISTLESSAAGIYLHLSGGPQGQFCYLLIGDGNNSVSQPPGAKGDLCIVGGTCLGRYDQDVGQIDSAGGFSTDIKSALSNPCGGGVSILPGATWNFQYWHRQPMGQPATFSAALAATFH